MMPRATRADAQSALQERAKDIEIDSENPFFYASNNSRSASLLFAVRA
jgi:hypothetical protein